MYIQAAAAGNCGSKRGLCEVVGKWHPLMDYFSNFGAVFDVEMTVFKSLSKKLAC
jgi:hypothetical protein